MTTNEAVSNSVALAMKDFAAQFIGELEHLRRSCITCEHFNEANETCRLYGARPPARVIALACPSWLEALPF